MNTRRIARVLTLLVVVAVQQLTDLFAQYPLLQAVALVAVAIVMLDAIVCARRRWRSIRAELG